MRVINVSLSELETKVLMIGFQGENEITQVRIDAAEILTDYPTATPTLIVKPLFGFAYPVIVAREGTDVVWEIDNSVLSIHGDGEIQLTFTQDSVIAKSYVGRIRIKRSLEVNGETPDPIETWEQAATAKLAEVDAQISELEDMVEAAEAAKDEAQDIVDDATADIQAAGAAQVQVVNTAGSTQTAAVQAKGTEVLNSIPADYTALSGEVTDLKSALNDLNDTLIATSTDTVDLPIAEKQTMKQLTSTGEIADGTLTTQNVYAFDVTGYNGCAFSFQGRVNAEQNYAFYTCDSISECGRSTLCSDVGRYSSGVEIEINKIPAGAKLLVAGMRQNPYKIQGAAVTVSAKSDANLAETYSLTKVYTIGEFCIYSGSLYRRIVETGQAGEWVATEWENVRLADVAKDNADEIATLSNDLANAVLKEEAVVSEKTLLFTDAVVQHSQKLITSDGTITDGTLSNQIVTEIKIPSGYDVLCFKAQSRTTAENLFAIYNADSFEECGPSTLVLISGYKNESTGEQNEIAITEETKIICILSRQSLGKCDVQKKQTINPTDLNFAEPYDSTTTYRGGEYCTKDGTVYKRKITDSYSPEEWDISHWDAIKYAFEHEIEQDFTAFSDFVVGRINTQTGGIISSYVSAISKDIFKLDRDIIVSISDGYWFNFVAYGSYEESSIIRSIDSGFGSNLTHIPAGTYMRAVIGETGRQSTEQLQESEIKNIARKITFRSAYGDQQVKIENGQMAMYQSDTALMFQKGAAEKTLNKQPCILVAGQSNIDGRVPASSLPSEVAAAFPNVLMANSSTGAFSSIGQASGNQGIDRSMYKALNDSGNGNIYIIKRSMGATAISPYGSTKCWTPWYEELDDISNSLLYSFDLLTKKCVAQSGSLFDIKAFLWQQGEGDYSTLTGGNRKAAFAYYRNFKALVAYVRGMANNPRLPIVCGTVSHLSGQYDPIVEAATIKVAEEDPYMTCIDMSGAGLLDAYHFNADAAVYFGYKAFDALIDFGVVTGTKINPTRPW